MTITSGKGGVGKSLVSVNLAEKLVALGHRVALVDADFGQGACPILLNEQPGGSVLGMVRHESRKTDVLHKTQSGLTLVQAVDDSAGADRFEDKVFDQLDRLLSALKRTHTFIIIDTPAGMGNPVRWALDRADIGLLVLVGEPTAIADAYRLVKLVRATEPKYPLGTVINFAENEDEATDISARFSKITAHFTGQETMFFGWVPFSPEMRRSVNEQHPAIYTPGAVTEAFTNLAQRLIHGKVEALSHAAS